MLCAGGEQDAQEAYEEAVNAIFVFQVTCHRHTQPHQTQHGSVRWEMIEMWPMQVVAISLRHCTVSPEVALHLCCCYRVLVSIQCTQVCTTSCFLHAPEYSVKASAPLFPLPPPHLPPAARPSPSPFLFSFLLPLGHTLALVCRFALNLDHKRFWENLNILYTILPLTLCLLSTYT